ncbi:MAG: rhomboid family intramembrane serine protease [Xanthomonadales bacterium]|jgi:membrane associated rhomboid family serine protease|nr:rhomboid family intramembrane serine protease [Xanthomonadales bacterium]
MFVQVPSRRKPSPTWVTPLLVALSMGSFVWMATLPEDQRLAALVTWGTAPEALFFPTHWRETLLDGRGLSLFTALFVHANWLHVLGNMLFLMIFGLPSERSLGPVRFGLLFLLAGAAANLAAAWSLDGTGAVLVGSSGAVSGLIGAFWVLFPRAELSLVLPLGLYLEFVRTPAGWLIAIWAGLQLVFAYVGPELGRVAWAAHLSGLALGVLSAALMRNGVNRRLRARR